jgi:hypothetical protein
VKQRNHSTFMFFIVHSVLLFAKQSTYPLISESCGVANHRIRCKGKSFCDSMESDSLKPCQYCQSLFSVPQAAIPQSLRKEIGLGAPWNIRRDCPQRIF